MPFDVTKEYPKTFFALKAVEAAIAEETSGMSETATRNIAMTALGGLAVMLANVVNGKGAGREVIDGESITDALTMLSLCIDATIRTACEEDNHEVN